MSDRDAGSPECPRLVLCLMVKNEEKIIERCLRSVLPHVDGVVVCWNGTDETRAIANRILSEWDRDAAFRSFHFEYHEWVNFGHNRSLSAKAAKGWVREMHREWPLDSTYLLFMDADMELVVEPGFDRKMLTAPGHYLIQLNHGEFYPNLRLARLSHDWRAVSVTHEYWAATPDIGDPPEIGRQYMWLRDHDDGGSKSDKTERDIRLLEQGLIDEPGNVRYMFYLARAYADSGKHEQAVALYRKRRDAGGWDQEAWYAHYREGLSLLALGREAEGVGTLVAAYQRRPSRVEPLVNLASHHRERGRNHAALLFARQASKIPLPSTGLFVWADAYQTAPLKEIAISAYYTEHQDEGIAAAEKLIGARDCDAHTQAHMLQTLSFYVKPMLGQANRMGVFAVSEKLRTSSAKFLGLTEPNTTEYVPKNPAIVTYRGTVYANLSLVNYYHERGVVFAPKDPDGIVRTRNVVVRPMEPPFVGDVETTPLWWPSGWNPDVHVRGLEDQRWVVHEDRIWFTATCFHPAGRPEVVLGRLNTTVRDIEFLTTLKCPLAGPCEKNWVPWETGRGLLLIYGFDPFTLLRPDCVTGECEVYSRSPSPVNASSWRGGTPPVRAPWGRWVMLVHVVAHFDDHRVYMHRWVELAEHRPISRWSTLVAFGHVGVEYATGLLDKGDTVLVAFGSEEREACWMEFDWSTIDKLLEERK
jgi:glycosyltransferase involved in cell wall biosynthesis